MKKVIIWHNNRCSKSRAGLQYLRNKGIEPEIFEYLKSGIDPVELADLIQKSRQPVSDFIRKKEKEFRELQLKGKELSAAEFAQIAAEYPKLLERPIVIHGEKVVLARPATKIDEIL